jgi:histidinol dehydrogenase
MRDSSEISNAVRTIVANAREGGEQTLLRYTAELDGVQLESIAVSSEEIAAAPGMLTDPQRNAISTAIDNVRKFHAAQITQDLKVETVPGVICERVSRPIQAVGLYVPAGSAPLPSTAVMLAAPAELANCPVRVLCTPPRPDGRADPAVIFAASSCGVRNMFKLGGAQAVAAMAYGISPVPKVDKIFGPGNAYVTAAKSMVAMDPGGADLDLPAGPSEVMVIADQAASPLFVAMDLLSQAEHGADSQVILVTDDMNLANAVRQETFAQTERLPPLRTVMRPNTSSFSFQMRETGLPKSVMPGLYSSARGHRNQSATIAAARTTYSRLTAMQSQ